MNWDRIEWVPVDQNDRLSLRIVEAHRVWLSLQIYIFFRAMTFQKLHVATQLHKNLEYTRIESYPRVIDQLETYCRKCFLTISSWQTFLFVHIEGWKLNYCVRLVTDVTKCNCFYQTVPYRSLFLDVTCPVHVDQRGSTCRQTIPRRCAYSRLRSIY